MVKFRKKPMVIEAVKFLPATSEETADWCSGIVKSVGGGKKSTSPLRFVMEIPTLEGTMRAEVGDWIIRGVKGEFYPCKPDIFAATYESIEESR